MVLLIVLVSPGGRGSSDNECSLASVALSKLTSTLNISRAPRGLLYYFEVYCSLKLSLMRWTHIYSLGFFYGGLGSPSSVTPSLGPRLGPGDLGALVLVRHKSCSLIVISLHTFLYEKRSQHALGNCAQISCSSSGDVIMR